jgi:hypothetical protein
VSELLAITGAVGYLTAIGLAIALIISKGKNSDLRDQVSGLSFDNAEKDRTIAATALLMESRDAALAKKSAELARCEQQKGAVYERNATAGVAGGDAAVDAAFRMYEDPGDQDPGRDGG